MASLLFSKDGLFCIGEHVVNSLATQNQNASNLSKSESLIEVTPIMGVYIFNLLTKHCCEHQHLSHESSEAEVGWVRNYVVSSIKQMIVALMHPCLTW